jgi:hypothetical protein
MCTVIRVSQFRARIYKRFRRPGIDSEDSIPPAYVAWRAGTTNRVVVPGWESNPGLLKRFTNTVSAYLPIRFLSGKWKSKTTLLPHLSELVFLINMDDGCNKVCVWCCETKQEKYERWKGKPLNSNPPRDQITIKTPSPKRRLYKCLKIHKHEIFNTFFAETKSLWSQGPVTRDFLKSYSIRPRYLTFKHFRVCSVSDEIISAYAQPTFKSFPRVLRVR